MKNRLKNRFLAEVQVQTRDRFGNAITINSGDVVKGLLYGQQQVSLSFIHLQQGRYHGALVPLDSGETLLDFQVAGESIVGSPPRGFRRRWMWR